MAHFQVELGGKWQDYSKEEDKILKRAFMAGFPSAKFSLRGQKYQYDFKRMVQINQGSGKERRIRAPNKWKPPRKPLVPAGPTTVINVPPGSPGTTIQVPYPGVAGAFISVNVPASAKSGQAMLVPVPPRPDGAESERRDASSEKREGSSWSTGAKVAAGGAAAIGVAGAAVGGVVLGEHIAEHGVDATMDAAGAGLEDAAEAVGDFAVDAGEFIVDAGESAGDFIMDLF